MNCFLPEKLKPVRSRSSLHTHELLLNVCRSNLRWRSVNAKQTDVLHVATKRLNWNLNTEHLSSFVEGRPGEAEPRLIQLLWGDVLHPKVLERFPLRCSPFISLMFLP